MRKGNNKSSNKKEGKGAAGRGRNVSAKYSADKPTKGRFNKKPKNVKLPKFDDKVRLNKYLANAGLCSRREADELIASGVVTVNGEIVTEMGFKVAPGDTVKFDGATVKSEIKRYVLLNKPADFSLRYEEDPAKKSVYQLIKNAAKEPLIPIGKMDKSAAGLLLFTNDSDLELKLTHPQFKVSQLFHVQLDKDMSEEDLEKLTKGLFVDNKVFSAEEASFVKGKNKNEIGIKVFTSKSNMVKLLIGKLGYKIIKLDRVEYAGLTKLDLPRGQFRHLKDKEVGFLKMS